MISFATSRPLAQLFPVEDFRTTVREVLDDSSIASLLQLGSPQGYGPLRSYLGGEDVLITSGCQQALDLLQRVLAPAGSTVLADDPCYPGLKNIFEPAGVRLAPLSSRAGNPVLAIVIPNFSNPTGLTMTLDERHELLRDASDRNITLVEVDLYSALRYRGEALPSLADLDRSSSVIQVGSFSKMAFPGLRIGWIKARRDILLQLTAAKQRTDLHSDQLSQAVLLRFAESGRLESHRERVIAYGTHQLDATLESLDKEMPAGTRFTRPEGGMNLWVHLPAPLDASAMLTEAKAMGVDYLPGRFFSIQQHDAGSFRLSFGGLTPERIRSGIESLGRVFRQQPSLSEPAMAIV